MSVLYSPYSSFNAPIRMKDCRALVHDSGRGVSFHQCQRAATVKRKGIGYCKRHDPVAVAKADAERQRKWDEEYKRKEAGQERKATRFNLFPDLVELLEKAPDFGGEPKTAFGREYREWLKTTKKLLHRAERGR